MRRLLERARYVVLARRELSSGAWSALQFSDYTNREGGAHNTISIGVEPTTPTLTTREPRASTFIAFGTPRERGAALPGRCLRKAVFRGKLAIAASGNVYAVLPDMRVAAASAAQGFES